MHCMPRLSVLAIKKTTNHANLREWKHSLFFFREVFVSFVVNVFGNRFVCFLGGHQGSLSRESAGYRRRKAPMVTNLMKTLSSPPSSEEKGGEVRRVERRKATGVAEWLFICGAKSKNSTTSSDRVAHSHSSFRCARRRRVFLHKFRTITDSPYNIKKW